MIRIFDSVISQQVLHSEYTQNKPEFQSSFLLNKHQTILEIGQDKIINILHPVLPVAILRLNTVVLGP